MHGIDLSLEDKIVSLDEYILIVGLLIFMVPTFLIGKISSLKVWYTVGLTVMFVGYILLICTQK